MELKVSREDLKVSQSSLSHSTMISTLNTSHIWKELETSRISDNHILQELVDSLVDWKVSPSASLVEMPINMMYTIRPIYKAMVIQSNTKIINFVGQEVNLGGLRLSMLELSEEVDNFD